MSLDNKPVQGSFRQCCHLVVKTKNTFTLDESCHNYNKSHNTGKSKVVFIHSCIIIIIKVQVYLIHLNRLNTICITL